MKRLQLALSVSVLGFGLAACGNAGPQVVTDPNAPRGIFISTGDCVDSGQIDFETCAKAVNVAIEAHKKKAPTYPSLRACEATEGEGKCERTVKQSFRPRLLAFLVVGDKNKPTGEPLYFAKGKEPSFQNASKTVFKESDLTLTFSRQAIAAYQVHGS